MLKETPISCKDLGRKQPLMRSKPLPLAVIDMETTNEASVPLREDTRKANAVNYIFAYNQDHHT